MKVGHKMECSWETFNWIRLGDKEGALIEKFRIDPHLGIWKGTWSERLNGCECGVSDGFLLEDFQLEPESEMWMGFWPEISNGSQACSSGAWPGNLVEEPVNFCHGCGNPLRECCQLTLKVDEKGN